MNHDKVIKLLKKHRSYKFAVNNGVAPFVEEEAGMPFSSNYGSRPPRLPGMRGTIDSSLEDFRMYSRIVRQVESALNEVLDDQERDVIRMKYLERNKLTLERIAERNHMHKNTVTAIHKRALDNLSTALMFVDVPEIIDLDNVVINL